jgi:WhiB family redox-sensing transcriptional regulator
VGRRRAVRAVRPGSSLAVTCMEATRLVESAACPEKAPPRKILPSSPSANRKRAPAGVETTPRAGGSSPDTTPDSRDGSLPNSETAGPPHNVELPKSNSEPTAGSDSSRPERHSGWGSITRQQADEAGCVNAWMLDGSCRGSDPDMWYTDRDTDQRQAIAVCTSCPVRVDCLGWALTHEEGRHGIWAGYSERKLRSVKKAWRRGRKYGLQIVRGISPWAVGALDELARRGVPWGDGQDD